jgi:hypothetical protein
MFDKPRVAGLAWPLMRFSGIATAIAERCLRESEGS